MVMLPTPRDDTPFRGQADVLLQRAKAAPTPELRLQYLRLRANLLRASEVQAQAEAGKATSLGEETGALAPDAWAARRVQALRVLSARSVQLKNRLLNCARCALSRTRAHVVPWRGPVPATLAVVGEAPGWNENRKGQPFVGRAGQLLSALLVEVGIDESQLFVTNSVLCRPTDGADRQDNRAPTEDELAACAPNLEAQLDLCGARAVLALGVTAMVALGVPGSATRRRATWTWTGTRAVYVTYHPAAALRDAEKRRLIRDDLLALKPMLERLERGQKDALGRRYDLLSPYDPRPDLDADSATWSTLLACALVFSTDAHGLLHYLRCEGARAYPSSDGIRLVLDRLEVDVERELRRYASLLRKVPVLSRRQVAEWEGYRGPEVLDLGDTVGDLPAGVGGE